nr:MAG TPA: hypothetical protein [Caudoviricetes sp.]
MGLMAARWCFVGVRRVLIFWWMVHVLMCIRFLSWCVGLPNPSKRIVVFVLM